MSNPALNADRWEAGTRDGDMAVANRMTVDGTIMKTLLLLALLVISLGVMWSTFWHGGKPDVKAMMPWLIGGGIVALVLALVGVFFHRAAPVLAPIYAVAKGITLGGLTMFVATIYPGIAEAAAVYTTAVLIGLALLYKMGIIRASDSFVRGVMIATAGLMIGTLALWVLGMFGIGKGLAGALYGNGWIGIGFSGLCVVLAALNLVVDFKFIEEGAQRGAPKHYEWVGAFALLITLAWLYVEILVLLMKLRGGSDD